MNGLQVMVRFKKPCSKSFLERYRARQSVNSGDSVTSRLAFPGQIGHLARDRLGSVPPAPARRWLHNPLGGPHRYARIGPFSMCFKPRCSLRQTASYRSVQIAGRRVGLRTVLRAQEYPSRVILFRSMEPPRCSPRCVVILIYWSSELALGA